MNEKINTRKDEKEENLEKLAPSLFKIQQELKPVPQGSPFKVPAHYFENLGKEVMDRIASLPDFNSVSAENPFRVPEGYFAQLPSLVQDRIAVRKSIAEKVREWISGIHFTPKYALAFASVLILLFLGIRFVNRTITVDYSNRFVAETELESEYLFLLDESILADALESESPEAAAEEGLEDYLLENDFDLNSITDQL